MSETRRRPDGWPTTAPNHPDMLDEEHFAGWAEWAETERRVALTRARQCRKYRRLLETEYVRRYGKPIPVWEEAAND